MISLFPGAEDKWLCKNSLRQKETVQQLPYSSQKLFSRHSDKSPTKNSQVFLYRGLFRALTLKRDMERKGGERRVHTYMEGRGFARARKRMMRKKPSLSRRLVVTLHSSLSLPPLCETPSFCLTRMDTFYIRQIHPQTKHLPVWGRRANLLPIKVGSLITDNDGHICIHTASKNAIVISYITGGCTNSPFNDLFMDRKRLDFVIPYLWVVGGYFL